MIDIGGTCRDRYVYRQWHNPRTRTYQPKCGCQKRLTEHCVPLL